MNPTIDVLYELPLPKEYNALDKNAYKDSYVSLIADVPADRLYKKFGFDYTQPRSIGMYKKY